MKKAIFVKNIDQKVDYVQQRLYRLEGGKVYRWQYDNGNIVKNRYEADYEYVVVSTSMVPYSGPESYIFGADADGNILDWLDLSGSLKGTLSFEAPLEAAGFTVVYRNGGN